MSSKHFHQNVDYADVESISINRQFLSTKIGVSPDVRKFFEIVVCTFPKNNCGERVALSPPRKAEGGYDRDESLPSPLLFSYASAQLGAICDSERL